MSSSSLRSKERRFDWNVFGNGDRLKELYKTTIREKHRAKKEAWKALHATVIQKGDCCCILSTGFRKALIFRPIPFVFWRSRPVVCTAVYLSFRHWTLSYPTKSVDRTAMFVDGLDVVSSQAYFIGLTEEYPATSTVFYVGAFSIHRNWFIFCFFISTQCNIHVIHLVL